MALWWVAVAVLVVGWMLWPARRHAWPVVLIVGDDPERVEGVVRGLSAKGHRIVLVGGEHGEVGEIVSRLNAPVEGRCESLDAAVEECGGPAALVLRVDGPWSAQELLRQV